MEDSKLISDEVQAFKSAFANQKDQKIVIYGTGMKTAKLLTGIEDWNVIGLLDRDSTLIGKEIYGKRVVDRRTAEEKADLLVINTIESYWQVIFARIKDWKIPIYFCNGQKATQNGEVDFVTDSYYEKTMEDLEKQIEKYDVISFDIFDTLIMRKVFLPMDVFKLVAKKSETSMELSFDFVEQRIRAAGKLDNPTYDEIYEQIKALTKCNSVIIEGLKECEWITDVSVMVARQDMLNLCKRVMEEKTVYFISDMYYTSEMLQEILKNNGLEVERDRIIVSCEKRKSKLRGTLWKYYKEMIVGKQTALHIGDNEKADVKCPLQYGVHSYHVRSAVQLLERSSLRTIASKINSLYASISMGLVMTKIFNSPFALQMSKGKVHFANEEESGYCLLGSLCFSFGYWLLKQSRNDGVEKLLFFARDGYLLIEQYRSLCQLWNNLLFPMPIYLEISRRTAMDAAVMSKKDIYDIIASYPYEGNLGDLLSNRFEINLKDAFSSENCSVYELQKDNKKFRECIQKYEELIWEKMQSRKRGYIKYLKTLGVDGIEKLGIVDLWIRGSTQFYLGQILKKRLWGYYFTICLENNEYTEVQEMKRCFVKEGDMSGKKTCVWKNSRFIESFFTSPEGMLLCVDENGKRQYSKRMSNQKFFDVREKMQRGIIEFFENFVEICRNIEFEKMPQDNEFSEELLDCFMDCGFEPMNTLKNSFYFDDGMLNDREVPIWESND